MRHRTQDTNGYKLRPTIFWSLQVMLLTEEYGINSSNIDQITANLNRLPILLFLGACSLARALPVGLSLSLARQSRMVCLNRPTVVVIETLRSIPMVAVRFFGVLVSPLNFSGWRLSPVYASLIVLIAFHGAYIAEGLRTGFLSIGSGQWDACKAVGLSHAQSL